MLSVKHYLEKTIKKIGHHDRLRDVMDQSYPIYACTRANRAGSSSLTYFIIIYLYILM